MQNKAKQNHVWVVKNSENLPIDAGEPRLLRMGLIAKIMSERGNDVIWWCSTLDHFHKKFRFQSNTDVRVNEHLLLKMIHSVGYKKNMTFRRIWHYAIEKRRMLRSMNSEKLPDVIIVAMPTIELTHIAVRFGKKHNVPVFVDIRDTFPEMYVEFASNRMKPLMKIMILPQKRTLAWALKHATGIIATSEMYLQWALGYAKRPRCVLDQVFHVSYPDTTIEISQVDLDSWYTKGIQKDDFVCCFFGQFGFTVDIETVLEAAKKLETLEPRVKFVICGVGEKLERHKEFAAGAHNVIFPGWVDRRQICALGKISHAGLMAYRPSKNYEMSMPNKFCEYLALGVAILLQPKGIMLDKITEYGCGFHYETPQELCDRIIALKRDPVMLETMKRRARGLYEDQFCAETVYSRLAEYVEEFSATCGEDRSSTVKKGDILHEV